MAAPKNSVWSAMNYVPPQGPCGYKASMVSNKCTCMRFMLHPVKAATSFECDGCNHHASFHAMENVAEKEFLALNAPPAESSRKRRRQTQSSTVEEPPNNRMIEPAHSSIKQESQGVVESLTPH